MSLCVFIIGLTILSLDLRYFNLSLFVHIVHVIKLCNIYFIVCHISYIFLQCFDAVGWAGIRPVKN